MRKKTTNSFFKKINYPLLVLSLISLFLIGSVLYNLMGENNKNLHSESIDDSFLSNLLKPNLYEKEYGHRIQMHVYNGCGETGFAETYKLFLRKEGFDVMQIGNEDIHEFTTIYYQIKI